MTATFDTDTTFNPTNKSNDLSRMAWKTSFAVSNTLSQTVGVVLMASALGMWFAPSAVYDPQTLMIKLGFSLLSAVGGIALFQSARRAKTPDVEFDQIRREIRVVRRTATTDHVLRTVSFDDLGEVEMTEGLVRIHDQSGELLVELNIEEPKAFRALRRQLTPAAI